MSQKIVMFKKKVAGSLVYYEYTLITPKTKSTADKIAEIDFDTVFDEGNNKITKEETKKCPNCTAYSWMKYVRCSKCQKYNHKSSISSDYSRNRKK